MNDHDESQGGEVVQIDAGALAAGIAVQTAAVAPQLLTPVAPVSDGPATTGDSTSTPPTPDGTGLPLPDPATIATMRLVSGLPAD